MPVISLSVFLKFVFLLLIYFYNLKFLIHGKTLNHIIGKDSWYRHGCIKLTRTYGIGMDSWY